MPIIIAFCSAKEEAIIEGCTYKECTYSQNISLYTTQNLDLLEQGRMGSLGNDDVSSPNACMKSLGNDEVSSPNICKYLVGADDVKAENA